MLKLFGQWIVTTPLHDFMVQVPPAFPTCETLHFIGLSLLFGALLMVDLRGMGFFKGLPLVELHRLVPVALLGFAINLVTGIMFIAFDPASYFGNIAFLVKMSLIPIAGINALVFEVCVFRRLRAGNLHVEDGALIKVSSALSLILWTGVLTAGRWIPFV
jgi:hypothetical protein